MAFASKTDYCGLVETGKIEIRSSTENKSVSTYSPDGENGETIAIEVYGENATPSCEYALKATLDQTAAGATAWQLGKVTSIGTSPNQKKYRLTSIKISTAANSPVKISASAQLVEDGATDTETNNYDIPALVLTTKHVAQTLLSAFTKTNGELIAADYDFTVGASLDTLVGDIISNGVGSGMCTVSGTLLVSGATEPTLTAGANFSITKPLTCSNPETAYRQYTFELKRTLSLHTSA